MQPQEKRKLQKFLAELKRMTGELEAILEAPEQLSSSPREVKASDESTEANVTLNELISLNREAALEKLREMKHQQLGDIFLAAGGAVSDKKKPKEWLVEQIVWRVYDFSKGHEAIRTLGHEGSERGRG